MTPNIPESVRGRICWCGHRHDEHTITQAHRLATNDERKANPGAGPMRSHVIDHGCMEGCPCKEFRPAAHLAGQRPLIITEAQRLEGYVSNPHLSLTGAISGHGRIEVDRHPYQIVGPAPDMPGCWIAVEPS
jgi:hypothetical protein